MFERYFDKPYRFVKPYRGTFWCRLARRFAPRHLRRKLHVARWHVDGLEHLQRSLDQQAGILLASNHCGWADAMVLGMAGLRLQRYFYYVVSYHLFKQSRFLGWLIKRMGGYSIWREGADREAIRATADILARAERPVVLFPEGTWFRQNDRLGLLQDGITLILRQAVKQSSRPIVAHPTGIKYWVLEDPRPVLEERLAQLERRLSWRPQAHLDLLARIEKLGGAMLAVKEVELLGSTQAGSLDDRINRLADAHVGAVEREHLGRVHPGWILERIRRLRQHLARTLLDRRRDPKQTAAARAALDTLLFCENLASHSHQYLMERPSLERLVETVQRLEETLTDDFDRAVVPLGAVTAFGPGIDLRQALGADEGRWRQAGEQLMRQLGCSMQGILDQLLEQGPPAEWHCPPPIEQRSPRHPAPATAQGQVGLAAASPV